MNTLNRSCTRRRLLGSVLTLMAAAELASAQVGGDIRVQGSRATFSVEAGRPLYEVAHAVSREYNWPVTFEQSVTVYPGDWIDVTRNFSSGRRAYNLRGGRFEFSYDLGLGGAEPEDPPAVLRAALDAHHELGLPGRYELVETAEFLHIVPVARRDEAGEWQPERSPLDSLVSLEGRGRTPDAVLRELRMLISESAGIEILGGFHPVFKGFPEPRVLERYEHVRAREVLRSLISTSGQGRLWLFLCGLRQDSSGTKRNRCVLNLMPYRR
ncbi:MAG: hypothetical protein OXC11_01030 [Rhodospirillales bacterium]|nr:hypothetical protein [Rhodospirillales bacterium]